MRGHCESAAVSRGAPAQWGGARGQVRPGRTMEKRNAKPNQTKQNTPKQTKLTKKNQTGQTNLTTNETNLTKPNQIKQTKPRQTKNAEKAPILSIRVRPQVSRACSIIINNLVNILNIFLFNDIFNIIKPIPTKLTQPNQSKLSQTKTKLKR